MHLEAAGPSSTGSAEQRSDDEPRGHRWPRGVYDVGSEPDPRFSLANERTLLAWLRTALALMAAGVGTAALGSAPPLRGTSLAVVPAVLLLVAGILSSAGAFWRWIATERALRAGKPLPAPRWAPVLGWAIAATGLAAGGLLLFAAAR